MQTFGVFILSILIGFCGLDAAETPSSPKSATNATVSVTATSALIGNWKCLDGKPLGKRPLSAGDRKDFQENFHITFNADGTGKHSDPFYWQLKDSIVQLRKNPDGEIIQSLPVSLEGTKLLMEMKKKDICLVLTRTP